MNKIKLIALDIDGTLLSNNKEISKNNIEAIKKAQNQGIYVVLATGRMYRSAKQFGYFLQEDMPIITYNGALIRELGDGKVLFQQNMPNEHVMDIYALTKTYGLNANFYVKDQLYSDGENDWIKGYAEHINVPHQILKSGELQDMTQENQVIKMAAMGDEEKIDHFLSMEYEKWKDALYVVKSLSFFLEFAHKEVNKGSALKSLGQMLGIKPEEMMAVGDNMNDLEMLELVGHPVIMSNGHKDLVARDWFVTKSNDEDGVGHAISTFID